MGERPGCVQSWPKKVVEIDYTMECIFHGMIYNYGKYLSKIRPFIF